VWPVAPEWPIAQQETAAVAGSMGDADTVASEPGGAPTEALPPHHGLRHIRVVRQVKIGDDVVEEAVAEAYIDPSEDPEPVRQRLREQLRREAGGRQARGGGRTSAEGAPLREAAHPHAGGITMVDFTPSPPLVARPPRPR